MRMIVLGAAVAALAGPLVAQRAGPGNPDELRARIAERFMMTYRQQAGLTEEQFQRFQQQARSSWEDRMHDDQERRQLFMALEAQMRPGVAANQDSVARILNGLIAIEERHARRVRADMEAYAAFLSSVQRAQLLIMMTRFERQVEDIMRERMERRPPRNPPNPDMR